MKLESLGAVYIHTPSIYEIIKKDIKINKGVLYTEISKHN